MFGRRRVSLVTTATTVTLALCLFLTTSCNRYDEPEREKENKQNTAQNVKFTITPKDRPDVPFASRPGSIPNFAQEVVGLGYGVVRQQNDQVPQAARDDSLLTQAVLLNEEDSATCTTNSKKFSVRPEAPVAIACQTPKELYIPGKTMKTNLDLQKAVIASAVLLYGAATQVFNEQVEDDKPVPTPLTACTAGVMARSLGMNSGELTAFGQFIKDSPIQLAVTSGLKEGSLKLCHDRYKTASG